MSLISAGSISLDSAFKGLSQDGGRADFSINPQDSLFNDNLSNESNFNQILLAGHLWTVPLTTN
jgi:hypothetical protein